MAQPQHVRNDAHPPFSGNALYEEYSNRLDVRGRLFRFDGYGAVAFPAARDYWYDALIHPSGGRGLAEFTNTNFVSARTNFRGVVLGGQVVAQPNQSYLYPVPTGQFDEPANPLLESEGLPVPAECRAPNPPCVMTFIGSEVKDNFRPSKGGSNPRASTFSIFDQDLNFFGKTVSYPNLDKCTDPGNLATCEKVQTNRIFALNRFNFDAAHEFLIPRAVAYSAGLIDYFFRGRLAAEDMEFTTAGLTLRVKNAIDPAKNPAWANETLFASSAVGPGKLTIAYEYKDAAGTKQYGASNTVNMVAGADIAPGQVSSHVYAFTFSIPQSATEVKYRLVFRGKLGEEVDAVAVGEIRPVSGFLANPSYVPADGIVGARTIYRAGEKWILSQEINRQAGSIDWKGWYQNGRPTKVLTWAGPVTRYFPPTYNPNYYSHLGPDGYLGQYSARIYQNGELFVVAPKAVLGAALTRDSAGKEWVVAICRDGMADVIYRRPNSKDVTGFGWQEIGRFTHDPKTLNPANMPWFFNGSGTEAQAMRSGWTPSGKLWLYRLKINIQDASASFSNEQNLDGSTVASVANATCTESLPSFSCEPTPSCSGNVPEPYSKKSQKNLTITQGGSFVVAVDYIDDRAILATYKKQGITRFSVDALFEQFSVCALHGVSWGSGTVCGSNVVETQYDVRSETFFDQMEKISLGDLGEVVLGSQKGSHSASYSTSNSATNGSGASDVTTIRSNLRYLDIRYGLYSVRSDVTKIQGPAVPSDVIGSQGQSYKMLFARKKEQSISFRGQETLFHTAPQPEEIFPVSAATTFSVPCNSTVTNPEYPVGPEFIDLSFSYVYDPLFIDSSRRGSGSFMSIAVDSDKNLFVSESKMDEADRPRSVVGYFNYLTGDDPRTVIPDAPDVASYMPIRVVK